MYTLFNFHLCFYSVAAVSCSCCSRLVGTHKSHIFAQIQLKIWFPHNKHVISILKAKFIISDFKLIRFSNVMNRFISSWADYVLKYMQVKKPEVTVKVYLLLTSFLSSVLTISKWLSSSITKFTSTDFRSTPLFFYTQRHQVDVRSEVRSLSTPCFHKHHIQSLLYLILPN